MYSEDMILKCEYPILIVGNSGFDKKLGKIIDEYSTVIRMNNFVIEGYEELVGIKVTHWCVNGYYDISRTFVDNSFSPFTIDDFHSVGVNEFNIRYNTVLTMAKNNYISDVGFDTSTGFTLLSMFKSLNISVDIVGFDGFLSWHYWDDNRVTSQHKGQLEMDIIKTMTNVRFI